MADRVGGALPSQPGGGGEPSFLASLTRRVTAAASNVFSAALPVAERALGAISRFMPGSNNYEQIIQEWVDSSPTNIRGDYQNAQQILIKRDYQSVQWIILNFFQKSNQSELLLLGHKIRSLPNIWDAPACRERLKTLKIVSCYECGHLQESIGHCAALEKIVIRSSRLRSLPENIDYCTNLQLIDLRDRLKITDTLLEGKIDSPLEDFSS